MNIDTGLAGEQYCYLTTTGRVSGRPHTIEIWFGFDGSTLRIADRQFRGQGRVVTDAEEDTLALRLLMEKYAPGYQGDLRDWERTSLPVAVELSTEDGDAEHSDV